MSAKTDLYYSWPTHFPMALSKGETLPKLSTEALTHTIMPAKGSPGFDIVNFEQKRADGIECEY